MKTLSLSLKCCLFLLMAVAPLLSYAQNAFFHAKAVAVVDNEVLKELIISRTVTLTASAETADFKMSAEEFKAVKALYDFKADPINYCTTYTEKPDITLALQTLNRYITEKEKMAVRSGTVRANNFIGTAAILGSMIPSLISGLGSFSGTQETDFYDALAKYITEEFKKSVTLSYMQAFNATMGKVGELQVLMPATYEMLKYKDPFSYPDFGNNEKETYNKDLRNILKNLQKVIEMDNAERAKINFLYFDANRTQRIRSAGYYPYCKIAAQIGDGLINKNHPSEILTFLDNEYYQSLEADSAYAIMGNLFHGLNLLQFNLRDTARSGSANIDTWVSLEQVRSLLGNQEQATYFFGLLYLEDKDYFDHAFTDVTNALKTPATTLQHINSVYRKYLMPVHKILINIQEFKKDVKMEDKEFTYYMQFTLDLLREANTINNHQFFDDDKWFIAQKTLDVAKSIQEKNYNNILMNLHLMLAKIIEKSFNEQELNNIQCIAMFESMNKYGKFMIDIVNCQSSDEMKVVISRNVAPANSFTKKRQSDIAIGVTAHPGFFAGIEWLKSEDATQRKKARTNFGITAPIGVDIVFGTKKKRDARNGVHASRISGDFNNIRSYTGKSWSIFAQVIDIGAIMNYRIANDSSSRLPAEVKLYQLFSPGVSISWAPFPNNGVNFGLGYAWTPALRSITKDGNELAANSNRFFFRVSWDLPLFHIYRAPQQGIQIN